MIGVTVRLYAMLREYGPEGGRRPFRVELPEGADLKSLLVRLRIPESLSKTAFVNNVAHQQDFPLSDGDEVALFPPVAGG